MTAPVATARRVSSNYAKSPKSETKANKVSSQEEILQKLKTQLSRYARSNDRKMVMQSLEECRLLQNISMEPRSQAPKTKNEWQKLEKEVTCVNVNGIILSEKSDILIVLKNLCERLCTQHQVQLSPNNLYQALILRLAKSITSADIFFQLNPLLGSTELILQHTTTTQSKSLPVPTLLLYPAEGNMHAVVTIAQGTLGLYRKSDISNGGTQPWIPLIAVVKERVNLTTGQGVRSVAVKVCVET